MAKNEIRMLDKERLFFEKCTKGSISERKPTMAQTFIVLNVKLFRNILKRFNCRVQQEWLNCPKTTTNRSCPSKYLIQLFSSFSLIAKQSNGNYAHSSSEKPFVESLWLNLKAVSITRACQCISISSSCANGYFHHECATSINLRQCDKM